MANWKTKVCDFFRCLLTPLANMFDHYLDAFYDAELRDCEPDKETGKNHCVYENYLDNEACVDKNNPNGVTISSIISPDQEHIQEKQILCISAEPGYGKEFFAKRLCLQNYSDLYSSNMESIEPFRKGRFPFIIKQVDMETFRHIRSKEICSPYDPLCALCAISMDRVLRSGGGKGLGLSQPDELNKLLLRKFLKYFDQHLKNGRLFVLFEKEIDIQSVWEYTRTFSEISQELNGLPQKNLLVFVFDDEGQNPFIYGAYSVKLARLSQRDIIRHIEFCTANNNGSIVREFKRLAANIPDLSVPDCLLFVTETHLSDIQNIRQAETAAELYQDCIRLVLERQFPDSDKRDYVCDHLQNQAMLSYYSKYGYKDFGMCLDKDEREKLCAKPNRSDHLLRENDQFRFEGCRDYLIAERLFLMLQNGKKIEQVRELLQCTDNNIVKRLIEIVVQYYKKDVNTESCVLILKEIWNNLVSPDRVVVGTNLEILTYFMEYITDVKGVDMDEKFIEQIQLQMSKPIYDNDIFGLISKAASRLRTLKINEKLKKIYLDSIQRRTQGCDWKAYEEEDLYNRRLLFYLGVYDEISTDILGGLTNQCLHPHVKYHLARAMVNNASQDKSRKRLRTAVTNSGDRVISQGDIILKSYILILKRLFFNQSVPNEENLIAELCEKLDSEEYWIRAHAADALGHFINLSIPDKLISALSKELNRLEENSTKLKVVNYTIEAICEFFYFPSLLENPPQVDSPNWHETLQETATKMLQLIDSDKLRQVESRKLMMSAYATIAEGVLYLTREKYKERPSFSGKHIKDTMEQFDENAKLVGNALDAVAKWGEEYALSTIITSFRNEIEQIRNEEHEGTGVVAEDTASDVLRQDAQENSGTHKPSLTIMQNTVTIIKNNITSEHNLKKEEHTTMSKFNFKGKIENQQIISDNAQGTQINAPQGNSCDAVQLIQAINALLQDNCTSEQRRAAEPIIQELSTEAENGTLTALDKKSWLDRLASALAITADTAITIVQAPWWQKLTQIVQQFFAGTH